MTRLLTLVLALLFPVATLAEEPAKPLEPAMIQPAGDRDLSEFLWIKRPVVIFADTAADPRYVEQIGNITAEMERLVERDVIVLFDTDPAAASPLRLKLRPRGFMLVLIGKDGQIKLRKPNPWSVRELTRSIDKMPMRQQEVRDRRAAGEES